MQELLIEMRKILGLLEVLVTQQHAETANVGIIDQTASDARRFGIDARAGQTDCNLHSGEMRMPAPVCHVRLLKARDGVV